MEHTLTHTLHLSTDCYLCSSASASTQQGRDHHRLKFKREPTTLILHRGYKAMPPLARLENFHVFTCDFEVN